MDKKLGNNLRETQEALINLLGFDYDTFKCTANFEQGSSDAFSKLTPKESKLVVMKILQLGKFEEYEKRCREIYNKLFDEGSRIKQELDTINKLVDFTIEDITPIEKHIKEINEKMIICNKYVKELKEKYSHHSGITYTINTILADINNIKKLDNCPLCKQSVNINHKIDIEKQLLAKVNKLKDSLNDKNFGNIGNIGEELDKSAKNYNGLVSIKAQEQSKLREITERNKKIQIITKNKQDLENKLNQIKKDVETYKKLIVAFGKDGIPSYIIENTIPEIELIVNELLDLIEIDMSVKLNMQKELKSGGIADTLDISIVSGGISRNYYNFSGGEKFIIDLALRTALSVILLRRKGCNNSTLIIDEGFGSLDTMTAEKIMQLISIIKEKFGFKKILVITHVTDLQANLPNKIFIEKKGDHSILKYNITGGADNVK